MNFRILFLWFLFLIFIVQFCSLFLYQEKIDHLGGDQYDLKKDGVVVLRQVLAKRDIDILKQMCSDQSSAYQSAKDYIHRNVGLRRAFQSQVGDDYVLQDYIWIIKKSSVHTCHRDNNGDFFNKQQRYPSYTLLIYLEDMDKCLGVIPRSHATPSSFNFNITSDPLLHLPCQAGDAILFNANLIHVGALNDRDDNLRIQLKVTHREDIEALSYYEDFHKVLNEDNRLPKPMRIAQKRMSCMVPIASNLTQYENIRTARGTAGGVQNIGIPQRMFSYAFYGNSEFYDLPNAF